MRAVRSKATPAETAKANAADASRKKLTRLIQKAEQGHASAQSNLGFLCEDGLGVEKNPTEAAAWYRKAAGQGDADAQFNLGLLYQKGLGVKKYLPQAAAWFRKAADQGDADAQLNLGYLYEKSEGVEKNLPQAAAWYRKGRGVRACFCTTQPGRPVRERSRR
jgi:TPR repeat protein